MVPALSRWCISLRVRQYSNCFPWVATLWIPGCNTASAKALRSIQQRDIPELDPSRRVLGIIRPTAEVIGNITKSNHVGLLATEGTIKSQSYDLEIAKLGLKSRLAVLLVHFGRLS